MQFDSHRPLQSFSQQNQQLKLVGGCNAIKSRDLKIGGRVRSPPPPPNLPMIPLALVHQTVAPARCFYAIILITLCAAMISISERQKAQILSKIIEIENFALSPSDGGITVRAFGERIMAECAELANSSDSVTPVFRTALVINWPEKAMESRYKRFRELFPQITTLSHLKHAMDSSSALSFCKRYLDINANKSAATKESEVFALTRAYQRLSGLSGKKQSSNGNGHDQKMVCGR